jgi:tetraprenyl-beta-curcumene synthase
MALLAAATRELVWGMRAVSREIGSWQRRAAAIPDAPIRKDALDALERKRTHVEGAALFWILPARRDPRLLRVLVAYETALEFLDNAHERASGEANGLQLHRALVEALDPQASISDYYRHHPWKDDGGFLRALVEACRRGCSSLPSYGRVRRLLLLGAARCRYVQSLNHELDPVRGGAALKAWAEGEFAGAGEMSWWELTAAASSSMGVHALLAQAADPACGEDHAREVDAVYMPWVCAASTMLDSYVDQASDRAAGGHSYVARYPSAEIAVQRMCEILRRSVQEARGLRNGETHAVIAACMVAMYLSKDCARTEAMRPTTDRLLEASGSLTRLLLPVLRLWRLAYAQASA